MRQRETKKYIKEEEKAERLDEEEWNKVTRIEEKTCIRGGGAEPNGKVKVITRKTKINREKENAQHRRAKLKSRKRKVQKERMERQEAKIYGWSKWRGKEGKRKEKHESETEI